MCQICQTVTVTQNKIIDRSGQNASTIFNQRTLNKDYRTLLSAIKPGLRVLDIGCGTGAISKDIAKLVGPQGHVIGIDNTASFITEGKKLFSDIANLELIHADILEYDTLEKFDLIVSARTFQWISTIDKAIDKVKELLKPQGQVSILDYNHEMISWTPKVPAAMQNFYNMFLMWRKDAGMNNRIGFDMIEILEEHGFTQVEVFNADEHYESTQQHDKDKIKVWSQVAGSKQMVEEDYITNEERLQAIKEYNDWVDHNAVSMTMKLREVRAILNS